MLPFNCFKVIQFGIQCQMKKKINMYLKRLVGVNESDSFMVKTQNRVLEKLIDFYSAWATSVATVLRLLLDPTPSNTGSLMS